MKSIDFLPDIYRQREALRRARWWWGIVVLIFGLAISASAMTQAWLRHGLHEQLQALAKDFEGAQTQVQELSNLQSQISLAGHEASLYTFLENPWPRTQLLAEIVHPLSETIRLTKIAITDEEQSRTAVLVGPRNMKAEEDAAARASAPEKDLARLQDETARRQAVIEIDGHTADVPRLHDYVSQLSRSPLIASATIKSLEAATAAHQGRTRFTLRLIVKPGYCQRGDTAGVATTNAPNSNQASAAERLAPGGGQ